MPYLIDNPQVGYVQARWAFMNPEESYLTKVLPATLKTLPHFLLATDV